jgi:hypothetical protein
MSTGRWSARPLGLGAALTRRSRARRLHCSDELLLEVRARVTQAAISDCEWTSEAAVYLAGG